MSKKPLDLDNWMKEIKEKAERLEKEINDGWKIERSGFFISIPTPKRFLECKEKDWEVARLYGMLEAIKEIKQRINLAVQGLSDELICEVKSIENQGRHIYDDYYSGLRDGYLIAIKIIKKYFPEVVKK